MDQHDPPVSELLPLMRAASTSPEGPKWSRKGSPDSDEEWGPSQSLRHSQRESDSTPIDSGSESDFRPVVKEEIKIEVTSPRVERPSSPSVSDDDPLSDKALQSLVKEEKFRPRSPSPSEDFLGFTEVDRDSACFMSNVKRDMLLGCPSDSEDSAEVFAEGEFMKSPRLVINYRDVDGLDDGNIFCDVCCRDWDGECPVHGPLKIIHDTKARPGIGDADRDVKTLPPSLSSGQSRNPASGTGVLAEKDLPARQRLGPYEGILTTEQGQARTTGYRWQIKKGDRVHHSVNAEDPSCSNWLRRVNCARSEEEQNLVAFQYRGQIYFRTSKPVPRGSELLVYYGDDSARELTVHSETSGQSVTSSPAGPSSSGTSLARDTAQEFADDVPDLGTCGRSEGAALTGAGTSTHPSAGDQAPHPSAGDQAPHPSAGDQPPHPSAGDQAPHPSAGDQAPPHRCDLCGLALHGLAEFQSHLDGHSRRLDVSSDHSGSDTGAENTEQDECRNVRRTYQDSKPSLDSSGQQRRSHASTVSDGVSASRVTDESGDEEDGAPGSGTDESGDGEDGAPGSGTDESGDGEDGAPGSGTDESGDGEDGAPGSGTDESGDGEDGAPGSGTDESGDEEDGAPGSGTDESGDEEDGAPGSGTDESGDGEDGAPGSGTDESGDGEDGAPGSGTDESGDEEDGAPGSGTDESGDGEDGAPGSGTDESGDGEDGAPGSGTDESGDEEDGAPGSGTDESGDGEDGAPRSGPHRCKKCGNCYKYARGLKTHLATHSDKASHKCSLCERAYKRRDVLLRHIREVHFGDVKPKTKDLKLRHVCDLCGKGFAAPIALKRHIKCHMGEKPFRCGECFKTFALKGDLTKHYMTHTQERPHKCELCDMQFARRTTLQKHMRIHTGEKPYTCETCGQGFSRQDVLSTHQRRHTGEQPYKCGICGAGFTHKPPLMAHLKKNGKCAGSNRQGDC
ncbi:zinc finger protein 316-like isoform X3 [Amphibalanus amphitrite]|uniref:zinc finger protein 316-like isoform X3 n=1 Tax=Amphibalanus amphitrite TaxID=1232801 RepID=UPI001C90BD7C|nr:zinc finger protein 316-like isoform X3 [Amphibalanus amphitrite]